MQREIIAADRQGEPNTESRTNQCANKPSQIRLNQHSRSLQRCTWPNKFRFVAARPEALGALLQGMRALPPAPRARYPVQQRLSEIGSSPGRRNWQPHFGGFVSC